MELCMTSLRRRMTEDMQVRNLSSHPQATYVQQVSLFARHFHQSPEVLGPEEIRSYQVYLTKEKKLSPGSILIAVAALRFLYKVTLHKEWSLEEVIPAPRTKTAAPFLFAWETKPFRSLARSAGHTVQHREHFIMPAVIKLGCPGRFVISDLLRHFQLTAVLQIRPDAGRPEGMIANSRFDAGRFRAPADDAVGVLLEEGIGCKLAGLAAGGAGKIGVGVIGSLAKAFIGSGEDTRRRVATGQNIQSAPFGL